MVKIHILALDRDPIRLARAHEQLRQRFEAGEDLGSRIHHIRSLVSSIEASLRELNRVVVALGDRAVQRL